MFPSCNLKSLCVSPLRSQVAFIQSTRAYSSRPGPHSKDVHDPADLDAARKWRATFNKDTIPKKIAHTRFDRGSGNGGQKTQKTSSKATTHWPLTSLVLYVPKVLHSQLQASRYYASKSDSFVIQCDSFRNRTDNENENHARLFEEVGEIYDQVVPGITSPEQAEKVRKLQKAENAARLKFKKKHSDKKSSRTGGGY